MPRRRAIFAASGVDEYRQGLTSDPWGSALASGPGLRVPLLATSNVDARYIFLLATCQIDAPGVRIVGLKTHYTIGSYFQPNPTGAPGPFSIQEQKVTTPSFTFPDGNVSYHLVLEPNVKTVLQRPSTDAANFCYQEADGPALLYGIPEAGSLSIPCTWAPGYVSPITGAPLYYSAGMLNYFPPSKVSQWEPVASLGCFYHGREDSIDLSDPRAEFAAAIALRDGASDEPGDAADGRRHLRHAADRPERAARAATDLAVPARQQRRPPPEPPPPPPPFDNLTQSGYWIWRVYGEFTVDLDRDDPPRSR